MLSIIRNGIFLLNRIWINITRKDVQCKSKSIVYPNTLFYGNNIVGCNSRFRGSLGRYSYVGDNSQISAECGSFCSIGCGVRTVSAMHPSSVFVSTHPAFYSLQNQCGKTFATEQKFIEQHFYDKTRKIACNIGNDVWIGDNVIIMGGVSIGDGAIIAAGAVVTHNVAPYTIVAGVPAKMIKQRFSDEQITVLSKIKWWNQPDEWLLQNANLFDNIEKFINQINIDELK